MSSKLWRQNTPHVDDFDCQDALAAIEEAGSRAATLQQLLHHQFTRKRFTCVVVLEGVAEPVF